MNIVWLAPWAPIGKPELREQLQSELRLEVCVSHPLFGLSVVALAKRDDRDDVLFALSDGRVAAVHLTWACKTEQNPFWPETSIFESLAAWAEEQMKTHHEEGNLF